MSSRNKSIPSSSPRRPAPTIDIVVPCFNEEDVLPTLFERLSALQTELVSEQLICGQLRVILVDDGSCDATWKIIQEGDPRLLIHGLKLSRNQGHQIALVAGLESSQSDVAISMDADLQDDPRAAIQMVQAYCEGAEIVFGVRAARKSDRFVKRTAAQGFYRVLNWLGAETIPDHADYRLMSQRALDALGSYGESNLYLRGLVHQIGLKTAVVKYDRGCRAAGESKYNLGRMIALALDGITSFSVRPLRLITAFGIGVAALSFALIAYSLFVWARGDVLPGWTSTVLPIYFLGGVHLVALGVIGEYIGKIYTETKRRPRYIIDEEIQNDVAISGAIKRSVKVAE
ncbi:MAG: glycosyltransferase family 2 protein [Pseudomonadota bacterium]